MKMIELFHSHPAHTIPVVLNSVKDFQREFLKKKDDMQSVWKQECIKHWSKSLDHKSFNFRADERKTQVAREFQAKLKSLIDNYKILSDPIQQRSFLEFYTGLEGQEAKALNLIVNENIDKNHPMLLQDPIYLQNFSKLPHFRFLLKSNNIALISENEGIKSNKEHEGFTDEDCLEIVLKILYLCIDKNNTHNSKQRNFLISFSRYFLNLGFVEKNIKELKPIEMSEELIDCIKNGKDFYLKYIEGSLNLDDTFNHFFFEKDHEVISKIKPDVNNISTDSHPPKVFEGILDSEDEDSNEDDKDEEVSNAESQPYITVSKNMKFEDRIKVSRFLPPLIDNQILFYGTPKYYVVLRFLITLFERVKLAKNIIRKKLEADIKNLRENGVDVTKIEADMNKIEKERFKCVIGVLFSIINNQKEVNHFEDTLRQLLGMQAYVLFTFDKAINSIIKPISQLKSEDISSDSWRLFKKYESSSNKFHEEMYYNDFLKLIVPGQEPEMLVRFVHCLETGIITCHGFSYDPFTTNIEVTKCIKMYGREYCAHSEEVGLNTPHDETLCYKSNGRSNDTGSIEFPFNPVFLKRNIKKLLYKSTQEIQGTIIGNETICGNFIHLNKDLSIKNGLSNQFCHNTMNRKFQANTEDVIIRKRQKIDEDKEFEIEFINNFKFKNFQERIKNVKDKHLK